MHWIKQGVTDKNHIMYIDRDAQIEKKNDGEILCITVYKMNLLPLTVLPAGRWHYVELKGYMNMN